MKRDITKAFSCACLLVAAVLLTACSGFLEREPLGRQDKEVSIDGEVFGIYAGLRKSGISALPMLAVHSMRSEDAEKGSSVSDGTTQEKFYDEFEYTTDEWLLNTYWADHYAVVHLCNNVIDNVERMSEPTASSLVNKAEAKFIRAFLYFNLVRAYGEVPLIDFRVVDAAEANVPKSSIVDIYRLIDADLQEAGATLPPRWAPEYIGRLTSGAAKALQARTFLARQNWSAAYASAQAVINSSEYNLNTPYAEIFRESGENCSESVFELQALYTKSLDYGVEYALVQGVRNSSDAWNFGWGWHTPTALMSAAFESGDPRRAETLLIAGEVNTPYGEQVPAPTLDIPRLYWNKKVYTNPEYRLQTDSRFGKWMNVRIIRYSDVVLMAAEAANELGGTENTTKALEYLEMVRARARAGKNGILPKVTTTDQEELRQAIRKERRVELGMEHERFFDLVRWGTAKSVLRAAGKKFEDKHVFLPIPQKEIDKSNGVLVQNPNFQ